MMGGLLSALVFIFIGPCVCKLNFVRLARPAKLCGNTQKLIHYNYASPIL
jgi:hypothetical protein